MILADWITALIFLPHKKIKAGLFASIDLDENGKPFVSSSREKRVVCEGSYSSSFTIRSFCSSANIEDEFEEKILDYRNKGGKETQYFLEVSGSTRLSPNFGSFLQLIKLFLCF